MKRFVWVVVGAALTALPLLPVPRWVGAPDPGPAWEVHLRLWALGLLVVGVGATVVGRFATQVRVPAIRWRPEHPRWVVIALALLVAGAGAFAMWWAFAGNPVSIDEMAQLFQARVFLAGQLAAPPPVPAEAFLFIHTWVTPAGWVSQFPPGHSLFLAVGMLFGAEWLVNPLLGAASLVLVYLLARGLYGQKTALLAALLWSTSAWVIFMSGTYMNHASAVAMALGAWAAIWAPRRAGTRHYVLAGLMLAGVAATRPLDALAAAVPVGVWLLAGRRWRALPWLVLGGAPVLALLGFVNWRLFGSPFAFGYGVLQGPEQQLGFHLDPWGNRFTPLVALSNLVVAVRRLHIYLFEWPIPALLPFAAWALLARHRHPSDLVLVVGTVAAPMLYFFYWHSAFYPGPRFYYITAPFLVIGTARAGRWAWTRLRRRGSALVRWDVVGAAVAVITIVWGATGLLPARFEAYRQSFPSLKHHPERTLAAAGVRRALVIVPESWGARLVVGLWSLGARPGLVERAYRRLDACDLEHLIDRARADGLAPPAVSAALDSMIGSAPAAAPVVPSWPDPTLRLRDPSAVPPECRRELGRDLQGFALYGTLAWRNPVGLDHGILFARDLFERNPELFARYRDWEIWRFAPPGDHPDAAPVLTRMRPAGAAGGA